MTEEEKKIVEANLVIGLLNCTRNIELLLGTDRIGEIIRDLNERIKEANYEGKKMDVVRDGRKDDLLSK